MKLKKWVRVVLTLILVLIGVKLYFASNNFSMDGNTNMSILCWMGILFVIPYINLCIWE